MIEKIKTYWDELLNKVKFFWYKYFTYINIKRMKIDPDEIVFVEIHESIDTTVVFKINNYIQRSLTNGEKVFVYRHPMFNITKMQLDKDDVIVVNVDYDVYTFLKSSGDYEALMDRVAFRFEEMKVDNHIILEPEGITYNKTEKEILRSKLK